uniref:P-type ATPase N-terminal domain-containing protein n=1 Tax=Romanomermis culicivorax TaxID=13658 RepID=A0A915JDU2_ROMCU
MNDSLSAKPYEEHELELAAAPNSSHGFIAPSSATTKPQRTTTAAAVIDPQSPKRRTLQQSQADDNNTWRRLERFGLTKLKSSLYMTTIISSLWNTVYAFLCLKINRRRHIRSSQFRTVIPNHLFAENIHHSKQNPNYRYVDNSIRTTKYSFLTFLPKNLFEQFHRFANIYFVFIVILNWFPQIETFGKELSMMPVLFVLTVTAVKDIYEDYRRYRSDKSINHSLCKVFSK